MTTRPEFNLVREPWIRVRLTDETLAELSLQDIFERLSEVSVLNGETPTQDTAVFRLLMAILIRALRSEGVVVAPGGSLAELWRDIYRSDDLTEIVQEYLAKHSARFDLFDPVAPFFQVSDLATSKGEHSDASVLIPDVGPALFSTRTKNDAEGLDAASAARWLVRLHAYDVSGIKSGAIGDSRVKDGKGYPIGTGWAGALGSVQLTGPTLRETLLLNLPMSALAVGSFDSDRDLPPWERTPDTASARSADETEADGVVDLLTWQQRRVRLFPSASTAVSGVLIANGDKLSRSNQFEEPYSAQRFSWDQTKKLGRETWFPRALDPQLTVWRGVQSIFAEAATGTPLTQKGPKATVPDRVAPAIKQLQSELGEAIDEELGNTPISLTLTGVSYGTKDAVIETELFETLPTTVALLTSDGAELRHEALLAIDRVLTFRGRFRWFFRQLLVSAGASPGDYPDKQVATWMDELQLAFLQWLAGLADHTDPKNADLEWRKMFYRITERAIDQAVDDAGPRAAIGRMEETDGTNVLHSSGRYRDWIMKQLREITGARIPTARQEPANPTRKAKSKEWIAPGVVEGLI
ncbi:type I-E CRISPR-associated protein Cse1/CasA [Bowdeniella nasicola]|uniref:Type I-E CRISPR-associated protein Cse1/CasA n=1 Tax=Bowdeniella nasicola TaxID=208480 RepID=A0A1Q5Q0E5_9ACTO|nr:type I-E CRISPR-associated protein Cse1/CasA [Bowdeniella nasicola]